MNGRFGKLFGGRKGQTQESGPSESAETFRRPAHPVRRDLPNQIGRYRIVREIGRGGMGAVYLAQDPFIERQVAIKTSILSMAGGPADTQLQQVFFNEARSAGILEHPNIVSLHDATVEDDIFYLVMEYIDGTTLQPYINPGNLMPIERVVKIISVCAAALNYAHSRGVIHGDIKPNNILISTKGDIKISDFGNAIPASSNPSEGRSAVGLSVLYSSPEQLRQEPLSHHTDQFSLGVVLYEMLTGVKPFMADTEIGTSFMIINEDPPPIGNYRKDVPESLKRILKKTLSKKKEDRYHSCLELGSELNTAVGHLRYVEDEINFQEKFNAIRKISFFKDFSSGELIDILKATGWAHFNENDVIIEEGQSGEVFFVILSGEVNIEKLGKVVATLRRGACFGEMAHLGKVTRTATVRAVKKTALMKINPSTIEQYSTATQLRFAKVFIHFLVQRLARTSDLLAKADW